MLKRIVVPLFLLLIAVGSFAQRFEGGLLAGWNATQVRGAQVNGLLLKGYHKPGFVGGAFVQTEVAPAVFMAMEIKYAQMGAKNKIKKENPVVYNLSLGYIDVPVYAGFRTSDRGSIVGGVTFGYLAHSKEEDEYGELLYDERNKFSKLDVRPFLGFKFDFLENLDVDLRFSHSIIPIRSHPGEQHEGIYWLQNQFNNVITIAMYYRLGS